MADQKEQEGLTTNRGGGSDGKVGGRGGRQRQSQDKQKGRK